MAIFIKTAVTQIQYRQPRPVLNHPSQDGFHRWNTLLLQLAHIQQYHILCSYTRVQVRTYTHTHSLKYYNYFVYIKKISTIFQSWTASTLWPCKIWQKWNLSSTYYINCIKKHYSLWKTERHIETREEQWPLADTHKWESNGIMFLCMSLGHSFIKWSTNFILFTLPGIFPFR